MTDYGAEYTDKELEKMEKKIKQIYSEAEKDIQKKMNEFNQAFKAKEAVHLQELKDGKITQADFDAWKRGQVFQGQQWQSKKDQISGILYNANKEAAKILNGGTMDVFAENANWSHYEMEHTQGVNFGFGLYDAHTVTNLVKNDPQVLPKWKVNEKKDYKWNGKKVDNAITQGIIQGERLDQIAERISTALSANNRNTMLTFARTAMTGAQNAGRNQGLMDAKELDIDVVKVWMATLDDHTRASHQEIDGEEQKVGDKWHPFKFSNGCRYPGDPMGPPHEVYNCRCTLVSDIKDYPSKFNRYDNIDGKPIENMSYKEWKEAKESGAELKPWVPAIEESGTPVGLTDVLPVDDKERQRYEAAYNNIINSHTMDQMSDAQKEQFKSQVLPNMSAEHMELYEKMTKFHGDNLYDYAKGGWYSPSRQRVEMDLNKNFWEKKMGRTDATAAWKTKFHEELHQLDHILAISQGYGRYSSITACENSIRDKATPIGTRLKEAISKDILNVINAAIDESNKANAEAASMLNVKAAKPLKHMTDLSKPITRDVTNAFFTYLGDRVQGINETETNRNKAVISPFTDAVGLMTRSRINPCIKYYWGHDTKYQKENGPNGATSECFAEIGSHIMRNDTEALEEIEKWMPNSVAEYKSVLTELWEYVKDNDIHY